MQNIIEVKNLIKKYRDAKNNAVNGISFDVQEGEFFAFLGINGAGKSTTINILCTLLEKTSGSVTIDGLFLGKQNEKIKKIIGVVFQNKVLDDDLTIMENLKLRGSFYDLSKSEVEKKISELAQKLGIDKILNQKYGSLSGGQRRKSDIARALINNPKILFLDEPTTGLDPQSRIDLWNIISDIRKQNNTTIFLTTHYMEEVNDADRVAIIDSGELLALDTPTNLKSKFSLDTIKLHIERKNKEKVLAILEKENLHFKFKANTFTITLKDAKDFIETLLEIKSDILAFEVLKGDMDSVFLNVVGRKFVNEANI